MSKAITHHVQGGFCKVCGETEEWLREHGETVSAVTLSATETRALKALKANGRLFARTAKLHGTRGGTFNRVTLEALVSAGLAKWGTVVMDGRAFDIVTPA